MTRAALPIGVLTVTALVVALAGCGSAGSAPAPGALSGRPTSSAPASAPSATLAGPLTQSISPSELPSSIPPASRAGADQSTGVSGATGRSSAGGSLAGEVIVIDPGHNGGNFTHPAEVDRIVDAGFGERKACNTDGTETNAGYTEAAYTFDVATRLAAILRADGAHVIMTRSSNTGVGPCIDQRAAIGNAAHADAVLSIHGDGNLAAGARGFHVIIANRMMGGSAIQHDSQRLADVVRAAFHSGTGMPFSTYTGGGVAETHRSDIGGLNLSTRPAVMIETGNMRSSIDAALMSSATFRQKEAAALASGLVTYLH